MSSLLADLAWSSELEALLGYAAQNTLGAEYLTSPELIIRSDHDQSCM